ncbi:MAG: ABC transporter permease [Bacteroidia bacterium]|nr:ABC transporter permease [Bacteroidia bacterium]
MFKNYLLVTFRKITRRKGFSILNVLGLSIGLAASLLILQYVKDELSYDNFHQHADNLYRVEYDNYREGEVIFKSATSFPKMAPTLKSDYPEIENSYDFQFSQNASI